MLVHEHNEERKKNFMMYITAHDAARIAKKTSTDPMDFLTYHRATHNASHPFFKIKGKEGI